MALETIQYYINAGSAVYAVLLDCTKAFDVLKYESLFKSLISKNICPLIARLIFNLYVNAQYCIRWNGVTSECFSIQNGVKQGGVISPLMFTLFLDSLCLRVINSKLGCHIGSKCVSILVFADDILILCPSRSATQKILNICHEFTEEVGLRFNPGKCKVILFGVEGIAHLSLGGVLLKCESMGSHIGNLISNTGDHIVFDEIINGISIKTNCIRRVFACLDYLSKSKLFNAQCCSLYGIELIDLTSTQLERTLTQWRKSIRFALDLHPRTHSTFLPHIIGSSNIEGIIYSRIACFFKKGYFSENELVSFLFRNCAINMNSVMCRNINLILTYLNLNMSEFLTLPEATLKRRCKAKGLDEPDWRLGVIQEMLGCRDGTLECGLAREEVVELLTAICIE